MKFRIASLAALALVCSSAAHAGPFGDEMAKCLVRTTSDADKTLLIQWIFAAMATHPDVKAMSAVSPQKGEELNKKTADLFITLLTQRCKAETEQALKFEGRQTLQASFEVLGQVAMQGIMADGAVLGYMTGLSKHVDSEVFKKAFEVKEDKE